MATHVLVDANVLYSRTLRDWLFLLRNATGGRMFTVWATEDIIAETIHSYRRSHPTASGAQIAALHDRISAMIDDRVDEYRIDGTFPGADVHDGHVHAAAVACGAHIVLTNDRGFLDLPPPVLDTLPYEPYAPDDFFTLIDDSSPVAVRDVTMGQLEYWLDHAGEADLPRALTAADCPAFAQRVRTHIAALHWP